MMCRTSTTIAALALLALHQPGWSAEPAQIDRPRLFAPPPRAAESESPQHEKTKPKKFLIRDPATAAPTRVKRANHEAELVPKQRVMLTQLGEQKAADALDALRDVTDDLQLDLRPTDAAEEAARDAANEFAEPLDLPAADAPDGRLPTRPLAEPRYASTANQPWTIPGLFNEPEDYHRQACEEEFCRQVWACAGGRQSSWFQRWRRDMRRDHELNSMGRCNAPAALFSGLFIEPLLGYGLFGGPLGVCGGRCQPATSLWGDYCVDCVDGGRCTY